MAVSGLCLLAAVLLAAAGQTSACSCRNDHKQEQFCSSDFVFKAQVRAEEIIYKKTTHAVPVDLGTILSGNYTPVYRHPVKRRYLVRINKIFHRKNNTLGFNENSTTVNLQTPYEGSRCGLGLTVKNKYLISGRYGEDYLEVNLCYWVQPWASVSRGQRRNLHGAFPRNCQCQISKLYFRASEEPNRADSRLSCAWPQYERQASCYEEAACIRDKNDSFESCKWHRSRQWRTCVQSSTRRFVEP